jgi:hypothetical protein
MDGHRHRVPLPARVDPRRKIVVVGIPAALVLVSVVFWLLYRTGGTSPTSAAPSASTIQRAPPEESSAAE